MVFVSVMKISKDPLVMFKLVREIVNLRDVEKGFAIKCENAAIVLKDSPVKIVLR